MSTHLQIKRNLFVLNHGRCNHLHRQHIIEPVVKELPDQCHASSCARTTISFFPSNKSKMKFEFVVAEIREITKPARGNLGLTSISRWWMNLLRYLCRPALIHSFTTLSEPMKWKTISFPTNATQITCGPKRGLTHLGECAWDRTPSFYLACGEIELYSFQSCKPGEQALVTISGCFPQLSRAFDMREENNQCCSIRSLRSSSVDNTTKWNKRNHCSFSTGVEERPSNRWVNTTIRPNSSTTALK